MKKNTPEPIDDQAAALALAGAQLTEAQHQSRAILRAATIAYLDALIDYHHTKEQRRQQTFFSQLTSGCD